MPWLGQEVAQGCPLLPATSLQPGGSRGSLGPDASSFEVSIPGGEECQYRNVNAVSVIERDEGCSAARFGVKLPIPAISLALK